MLVAGAMVFVNRFIAEYYLSRGYEVYVLNRNTRRQSDGGILIEADRQSIGNRLKGLHFDVVVDAAYTESDVAHLVAALGSFEDYMRAKCQNVLINYF